jgi:hypothetical protein
MRFVNEPIWVFKGNALFKGYKRSRGGYYEPEEIT